MIILTYSEKHETKRSKTNKIEIKINSETIKTGIIIQTLDYKV